MTSCTAALLVVLATTIFSCRASPPLPPSADRPGESRAPSQDTAFAGTLAPVQRIRSFRPGVARPVLQHVETRSGGGYDRVVFEFTGGGGRGGGGGGGDSVPGDRVGYT